MLDHSYSIVKVNILWVALRGSIDRHCVLGFFFWISLLIKEGFCFAFLHPGSL